MAGGGFATTAGSGQFEAKITPIVIISCIMAATGGLTFGYDIGVSVFLSEIAPSRIRGALNILFQLNVTIGILFANLVNYGTDKWLGMETISRFGRGPDTSPNGGRYLGCRHSQQSH
ncbi:hypothetical protein RYX36_002926 [Vicia faba]